jgi:hypothetical protein
MRGNARCEDAISTRFTAGPRRLMIVFAAFFGFKVAPGVDVYKHHTAA